MQTGLKEFADPDLQCLKCGANIFFKYADFHNEIIKILKKIRKNLQYKTFSLKNNGLICYKYDSITNTIIYI